MARQFRSLLFVLFVIWVSATATFAQQYSVTYCNGATYSASAEEIQRFQPHEVSHYCPVRSRIESAGWGDRVSFHGSLMAARPVKWAFSQIG